MLSLGVDDSWSFKDVTRTETSYLTHGYHRYPAKFIPQLAARVIRENTQAGDLVCDPFMGSGTTLVEAIVNGRRAYGTDINPIAVLIARAKTTPIELGKLKREVEAVFQYLKAAFIRQEGQALLTSETFDVHLPSHSRIDYWFPEKQKHDLALILGRIMAVNDKDVQTFLLCSFSNILKGCSRWMIKSVKPTIDKHKIPAPAYQSFLLQTRRMVRKNEEFWRTIGSHKIDCIVDNKDARNLALEKNSTQLIVTSPPYVTSYEHADLHQLTGLWLGYVDSLKEFRAKFIGSIQKEDGDLDLYSSLAKETVKELRAKDERPPVRSDTFLKCNNVLRRCTAFSRKAEEQP